MCNNNSYACNSIYYVCEPVTLYIFKLYNTVCDRFRYHVLITLSTPTRSGHYEHFSKCLQSFCLHSVLDVDVAVSQTQRWKLAMCIVGFLVFCLSCCIKLGFQCKRVFRKEKPRRIPVHSQTQQPNLHKDKESRRRELMHSKFAAVRLKISFPEYHCKVVHKAYTSVSSKSSQSVLLERFFGLLRFPEHQSCTLKHSRTQ